MEVPRIAIVQPVVPDYRVPLFLALHQHYGEAFAVYAGGEAGGGTIRMDSRAKPFLRSLANGGFGSVVMWQRGRWEELLHADLVIAPGSLRIASAQWLAVQRRLRKRPTILWGHAHGAVASMTVMRNAMFRLPDGYIAYTHTDGDTIRRIRGDDRVWVASNSCVWRRECRAVELPGQVPQDVLFVGRLVPEKKPLLLVDAFAHAVRHGGIPCSARLVIIGDGPLRAELETKVAALGIADRTIFTGHISDHAHLEPLYTRAIMAASPGYIGLSAIQSFAAGVPMVVSRNEKHSPEIEACKEGFNTIFFETNSVESLASSLSTIYSDSTAWQHRRPQIAEAIAGRYTYDGMINAFKSAIDTFI